MNINSYFSNEGSPATGLSPTIRIRRSSDGVLVINNAAMSESGDGFYRYTFTAYDNTQTYAVRCDAGESLSVIDRYAITEIGEIGTLEQVKLKTDNLPANTTQSIIDLGGEIAEVRNKTNNLPNDTITRLDVIDAKILEVKNLAEGHGTDSGTALTNISTAIANSKTTITDLLEHATYGLYAQKTLLGIVKDKTDMVVSTSIDFEEMRAELQSLRYWVQNNSTEYNAENQVEIQAMITKLENNLANMINPIQDDVAFIKHIEGGRWKMIGTQMVFYKDDNMTEIARFNFMDQDGNPSTENIFERTRV